MQKSSSSSRSRKAFKTANRILLSYLWILTAKRILGKKYFEQRIDALHEKNARRLKETILELKGLFTKFGQLLSIMSTILPDAYMRVLSSLQDQAPKGDINSTEKIIFDELGESKERIFDNFNENPIASASIGQVYKAQLKTGETVAVKVQHEDIEELAKLDLDIIQRLVKRVGFFLGVKGIDHVYSQVRLMVEEELDYQKEALSMQQIANNLSEFEGILIPQVHSAYSSHKIIVSDFHEGVKITNTEKLDQWGIDQQELAERLVTVYCKMILEDGFYHADPHPGNVLVNQNGEIILLDFGATARLDEEMRKEIPIIIQHIIRKDTAKITASLQKMGFLGNNDDSKIVAGKLVDALTNFVQNEIKIDNLNLKDVSFNDIRGSSIDKLRKEISIRELTQTLQVPKDWILLERAILLVHGISAAIAPDYNAIDTVKPYLKKMVLSKDGIKHLILSTLKQQLAAIIQLPSDLSTFLNKANNGELELKNSNSLNRTLYIALHQLMMVIGILTLILVYNFSVKQPVWTIYVGLILGFFLVRSLWKNNR